jgi:hypothetical protein
VLRGQARLDGKVLEWERVPDNGATPHSWRCTTDLDLRLVRSACRPR